MGELAIVLRKPPNNEPTKLGICGPITHATTPALRDYLRRLLVSTPTPCTRLRGTPR